MMACEGVLFSSRWIGNELAQEEKEKEEEEEEVVEA